MKHIIKIFSLLLIVGFTVSCENNAKEDLGYLPQEERGWVQFLESNPSVIGVFQGAQGKIDLDVNIQVPTTSSDLTINYEMVSVSGLDPNTVFSNDGKTVAPAGLTSYMGPDNNTGLDYTYLANISLDLAELEGATINEPMVFDVVLTGTDAAQVTAGLAGETFPTSQRIVVNPSIASFEGTYDVSEQFTGGPNAPFGLGDFFGESYQVELAPDPNDTTASKMIITNSSGFDTYFFDDTVLTFGGDGSVGFDDGFDPPFPVVALFRIFYFETSSYDYGANVIQCDGPLDVFGPYQFILTKQ